MALAEGPAGLSASCQALGVISSRRWAVRVLSLCPQLAALHGLQGYSPGLSVNSEACRNQNNEVWVPMPVRQRCILRCGSLCVQGMGLRWRPEKTDGSQVSLLFVGLL